METIANNVINSRTYRAVPRTTVLQHTRPRINITPKILQLAKSPLLWAGVVWLTICVVFVVDVLHH